MPSLQRRHRLGLVAATLATIASMPAHADYFVATSAQSYISAEGSTLFYGYNFDSLGHLTANGYAAAGGCALANCIASGSGTSDNTGKATASIDQTQMDSNNLSHDGTAIFHAAATAVARADLASGTLGVYAGGTHLDVNGTGGQDGGTGIGAAIANDTLHFSIAGADASTVTFIGVTYTIDGNFFDAGRGVEASAQVQPRLFLGNASFMASIDANSALAPTVDVTSAANWVSSSISPATPDLITFTGVYALTGSTMDLGVQENLNAQCGGGDICDYAHTARLSFSLPANVTYTSDSGVFLTAATVAAVPEPESYALMLAGFAAIGTVVRRKRAASRR